MPLGLTAATGVVCAQQQQQQSELPDIGNPVAATITVDEERQIGEMITKQLRDQGKVIDDPEVDEYVQSLGLRLASQASDPATRHFQYFTVREPGINAFAIFGGYIFCNYGTILASGNESELASVLAHETAHVTQRHLARAVNAQSHQGIEQAATILGAILIGVLAGGNGQAMEGAIAAAQGAAIQQQINFTRTQEYEADRVGIGFLASAGFDPNAMANFFEHMARIEGLNDAWVPEMLRDHPVSANRVAEARARAAQYERRKPVQSVATASSRSGCGCITTPARRTRAPVQDQLYTSREPELDKSYGQALTLMADRPSGGGGADPATARGASPGHHAAACRLGQAQMQAKETQRGSDRHSKRRSSFSRATFR